MAVMQNLSTRTKESCRKASNIGIALHLSRHKGQRRERFSETKSMGSATKSLGYVGARPPVTLLWCSKVTAAPLCPPGIAYLAAGGVSNEGRFCLLCDPHYQGRQSGVRSCRAQAGQPDSTKILPCAGIKSEISVFFAETMLTFCGSDYEKRVDFVVCSNFTHTILIFIQRISSRIAPMNNRSAFRRLLASRKYRQSILRNLLRGILSNRLIEALIPKWSAMSSMIDESKRGVRTLSKNVNTVVTPLREMMKPRNDRQHAPLSSYRLCLESLEDRRVMAAVPLGDIANIGTELNTIVHQYKALQASSITDTQWSSFLSQESSQFRVRGNSIYIEARGQGDFQAWKDNLSNLSFDIIASVASAKLIEGFMPIANLGAIANAVGTISVLPIWNVSPTDSVGTASNAAETTLKADSGSRLFGVDGTGITVGVISDSANQVAGGLNASKTSNNLNASAQVLIDNPGTDEGRAMMELIQDIAPAATLKFASGVGGEAAFATAVNALVTAGSNVIVDDLNLLTIEPYFYDGVASQSVTSAVTSGVTYFASAGNRGIGGFEMPYTDVNNTPAAAIGNGTYHDFDSGVGIDATQTVTLQPGATTFVFQWDQFWGTGVTTDMDFYVLNAAGTAILAQGTSNNVATQVAREIVSVSVGVATTAQIAINRVTGPAPGRFKYIGFNSPTIVEHTNEIGALVNPINPGHSSNANAISIAAANVGTPTTVASYSSRGPATRTLSPTGTAIPLKILDKPDFTSNDGAQTSVPGFQPFFGTSAAAPNAAGVAALLLDYNPALTPAQIRSALLAGVIDINTAGYDLATGNGLIDTTSSLLNLSSGVLTIDGDVGATNDNIIVKVNSSDSTLLDITINGTPLTPIKRTLITSIQINSKTGSDKLTIDLSSGNFIPAGGISFAGCESAGDDDQLVVTGYNVTNVTVNHTGPEAGNINLGGSTINFSEIEPLALAGSAANLIINLPAGPNNAVLGDDTNANFPALGLGLANTSAIDAPTFEYTSFTNPTNSLTVNLGPNGDTLTIQSLDTAFAAPNILIQVISGDNGNGSDSLSVNGADLVFDLEANKVTGVVGGSVSFNGIEHLNVTATATITINGKSSTDLLTVTPTGADTTSIVPSVGGLLSINTNNPGAFTINTVGGSDTVVVNGTSSNDVIGVARTATAAVTVGALKAVQVSNSESLRIASGDGNDTINVTGTGSTAFLVVDGGLNTTNDTLTITNTTAGTTTYTPGSTSDSGTIATPDGGIEVFGTELISLSGAAAGDTLTANGTHGHDTIALQFLGGANRIWLNGQSVISLSSFGTVNLNGRFGDDKFSVSPVGLVGVTTINVAGGDPTASDTLIISGSAGVDTVAFTPTGISSGSLTGLGAVVNFATTEHVVYDGNDIAAVDVVTINGTLTNDSMTYDANSLKGNFRSFSSPDFDTIRSARIAVNGGGSGVDVVNLLGSAGTDTVTSAANAITINTTGALAIITLGAGIDAVTISTLDNNDNINLSGITVTSSVFGGDGNDTIVGSPQVDSIYGGAGNDLLVGGAGNDFEYGEEGNDTFGNMTLTPDGVADDAGNDQSFGGEGFDNFVWEPGDGADVNNGGGDAADIFRFFGNAAANAFILRQGGTPTHFNALIGAVTIDNHGIEDVVVDGQGGGDTFTVEDLFATEVVSINLVLSVAVAADNVTVQGRDVADNISISNGAAAGSVRIQGLRYNVNLTNAAIADTLTVNGNDGDDKITANAGVEAFSTLTLNGGLGNDLLTGNVANLNGNDSDDTLVGGAGNQTMDGGTGDDTFVGNGGSDNIGGGAGSSIGDTILVTGTDGADVFNLSLSATGQLLVNINGLVTTYANFIGGPIATSGIEQIRVQSLAGNDGLTVDSTNGAIPIAINYDGGNNADTLTLTGGTATSDTYAVGPNID